MSEKECLGAQKMGKELVRNPHSDQAINLLALGEGKRLAVSLQEHFMYRNCVLTGSSLTLSICSRHRQHDGRVGAALYSGGADATRNGGARHKPGRSGHGAQDGGCRACAVAAAAPHRGHERLAGTPRRAPSARWPSRSPPWSALRALRPRSASPSSPTASSPLSPRSSGSGATRRSGSARVLAQHSRG